MLNEELKNSIRCEMLSGEVEKALKMLNKLNMKYDYFEDETDRFFVNYNTAWCYFKLKNEYLSKYYINEVLKLFEDEFYRYGMKLQYHQFLWLYSDIFDCEIPKEEYINNFIKIYNYYQSAGDNRFTQGATQKILFKNRDEEEIIKFMDNLIKNHGVNSRLVNDMVADCKEYSDHIYIKVKKIIKFYENRVAI